MSAYQYKIINEGFLIFCTKLLKSGVYFTLTTHLSQMLNFHWKYLILISIFRFQKR